MPNQFDSEDPRPGPEVRPWGLTKGRARYINGVDKREGKGGESRGEAKRKLDR